MVLCRGAALITLVFQFYVRVSAGLGPPRRVDHWYQEPSLLRFLSFMKGVAWSLLWPVIWAILIEAIWQSRRQQRIEESPPVAMEPNSAG